MDLASPHPTMSLRWAPLPGAGDRLFSGHRLLPLRLHPRSTSALTLARRRNRDATVTPPPENRNNNNKLQRVKKAEEEMEDIDDDALEALFKQLEQDLKNDDPSLYEGDDGDEELSQEEMEKLQKEIAEMDEEIAKVFDMVGFESEDKDEDDDDEVSEEETEEDSDDEEDEPLQLKNWQIRRLAMALKTGRRKTNIKNLAAELCMDRSIVLSLLRNPPPDLMMLSATLPDDEPSSPIITISETKTVETEEQKIPEPETETETETPKPKSAAVKVPVHVMKEGFSSQKRIKKSHLQTLEDVYRRSKRPTNAMIQSIVDVTNLPRKRVVKWFEEKRNEEGVPENRTPYKRSLPE